MPWSKDDAARHTKKATTAKLRAQWAAIANDELAQHGDDAAAIRAANGVIKREAYQHEAGLGPKPRKHK